MNKNMKQRILLEYFFCITLVMMSGLSSRAWAENDETNPPSEKAATSAQSGGDEQKSTERSDSPDKVPFTFDDVATNLVIINCKSALGDTAGSGFIAKMDGKTYIFTNQHVIMGADRIEFVTVKNGEKLKPTGVELSIKRDIARLLIADRSEALEISGDAGMGIPLAVFGNSEGAGVATELYGNVVGVGADRLEVSAEFVSGNSGSPVINKNKEVIGIASYVRFSRPSRMTENTRFENKARRFCYRLTDVQWAPVNWRKYNNEYGRLYRENDALVEAIFKIINRLYDKPFGSIPEYGSDSALQKWCGEHNRALGHGISEMRRDLGKSTGDLSAYCKRRGDSLEMKLRNRDLTAFLREEFEGYIYAYQAAADALDYLGAKLPGLSN